MSDAKFKNDNGNVKGRVINKNSDGITISFSGIEKSNSSIFNDNTKIYRDWETDRKSTRLNSSHRSLSRMPSSA